MVIDGNKFGKIDTPFSNLMQQFTVKQLALCDLLGCVDTDFYPDKSKHSKIIKELKTLGFAIEQRTPINW